MLQDVHRYSMELSTLPAIASLKASVARHERLQHVRDQRHDIDRFAVGLRMQRGVMFQVGLQAGWACESQLDGLGLG